MRVLEDLLTPERITRFQEVASQRLQDFTLLFDRMNDPHNVAACLRSAESFGLSEVHFIRPSRYKPNKKISMYSAQWLQLTTHASPEEAISKLKEKSFSFVGTRPEGKSIPFQTFLPPSKMVLVLGAEKHGISPALSKACEAWVHIPTYGFTQSLNLSTATAILTQAFSSYYRNQDKTQMNTAQTKELVCAWTNREISRKTRGQLKEGSLEIHQN